MKNFFFILSCFILPFATFAEDEITNIENEVDSTPDLVVEEEISSGEATEIPVISTDNLGQADLSSVYFSFCNNGIDNPTDSLNAAVELGKPFRVCMLITNVDKENDAYLNLSFVRGLKNEAGYSICDLQSLDEFVIDGELGNVIVPANNYLVKEFKVSFPIGYDGEQDTCIGISSVDRNPEDLGGLKVIARRIYYASFFVGGGNGLKNLLDISDIQTKLDENNNLILSFYVNNLGNMENTYEIQGNIKGLFNFQRDFSAVGGRVIPNIGEYVEIPLGELPSYGGLFKINLKVNGTPYFSYDISNANIDPAILEPKTFNFTTKYFKMPWLICGIILFFIILIILLFRRPKAKVVYVQQPQQPTQTVQPQQPQQYNQQPTPRPMQPIQPNQQ